MSAPLRPLGPAIRGAGRELPGHLCPRGFTLIEIVVAILVLSLTILAVGPMMTGITRGNIYGQNVSQASARVQEKVEQLKNTPYDNVASGSETMSAPTMTRAWKLIAEPVPGALKEMSVTVTWKEGGKTRYVSLRTFIASRTPRTALPDDDDD